MEKSNTLGWDLPALLHRFFYSIFFNWKNNNIQLKLQSLKVSKSYPYGKNYILNVNIANTIQQK